METSDRPLRERMKGAAAAAAPARESDPMPDETPLTDERIAELRRRVLSGTYEVDAAKLSAKIVEGHLKR